MIRIKLFPWTSKILLLFHLGEDRETDVKEKHFLKYAEKKKIQISNKNHITNFYTLSFLNILNHSSNHPMNMK